MITYKDRRIQQGEMIAVLLAKHREALLREDNKLRQELKQQVLNGRMMPWESMR
mgnify:CR=1 FL=1